MTDRCPICRAHMDIVCDPTGAYDYPHCWDCWEKEREE